MSEATPNTTSDELPPVPASETAEPAETAETFETAGAAEFAAAAETSGRHRRTMTGTVVSTKMDKTAVVAVTRVFLHPKYRKYVRRKKKYMTHDEHGACKMGDFVVIEECRPMSRHKHWRFMKTIRKGAD